MLHIKSLDEGRNVLKALGSDIRIDIVKVLINESGLSMNELAERLNITNGALTSHIKKLEECGIVMVTSDTSGHGNQKMCSVHLDKILFELQDRPQNENVYTSDIKVGHYTDFSVYPTCGLASSNRLIGEVDDNRYFAHSDRYEADILWFTRGYVEYTIPNFVPHNQIIDEICISAELSSEAPGVNNVWPSDIYFYLNDTLLGTWISPGDYGDVKGIFTPDWWFPNWNQYGLLKMLVVNHKGTFIDGLKISDVNIDQFKLTPKSILKFKLEVPENAEHVGGLTIFGRGFGNYNQDIIVKMTHSPKELKI
ncbi:MAG: winged helix-turn-helix transcriptional regulator [Butyrivibrio sp.]|uniref:ArsR/SmtB family transcription factor n=1 Tax=Butyrivibrio sp. TaxID=28121 RepID=UPI0025E9F862|nr:winged helix-turn-helix transcriptional regulator [Butyrivibrio sp.]MCR5773232.1 winged helix-turn-helix transcriptional regulator [Butyrivibrio sp.]